MNSLPSQSPRRASSPDRFKKTVCARHPAGLSGFSLIEMLAAMAILVLLMVMVTQIMNGATKSTAASRSQIDADSEARMVLDRMEADFARIVNRSDMDFLFKKKTGNDEAYFFSEAPTVTPDSATVADPAQSVSLVGYRINSKFQLERLGKGLTWNGAPPEGAVFLTYAPVIAAGGGAPTPTPSPLEGSTLDGAYGTLVNAAPSDTVTDAFHVLGENVFRLEFTFLLKPYRDPTGVYQPAAFALTPYNPSRGTVGASPEELSNKGWGLKDVQAIVVTLALTDGRSRNSLTSPGTDADFSGPIADLDDSPATKPPVESWKAKKATEFSIRPAVAAQIRIYQRVFYLNSGVN